MNPAEKHNKPDEQKSPAERMPQERGVEHDADLAPRQNRPPGEQHRGGPLPNQKR